MKILFPIGSFYPSQQGGPCNSVYALAKGLVKAGVDVSVLTTSFDIDSKKTGIEFDRWIDLDGMKVFYMAYSEKSPAGIDLKMLLNPSKVLKILENTTADIIHSTMLFTVLSHISSSFAKRKNIPLIWSPRGSMLGGAIGRSNLKKKLFLTLPFVKKGIDDVFYHATSPEEAESIRNFNRLYLKNCSFKEIFTIPNLASSEIFEVSETKNSFQFKYILYLGRIHPIKNIESLIRAFAISKIPSDIKLLIAGWTGEDLNYSAMLKSLVTELGIGERVVFTEKRVEGEEKSSMYKNAEIFVLPSHSENFGMVVVESLAQGTPVITSKNTPWQILEEKNAGFWIENNLESIAKSLENFFLLPNNEKEILGKNAKSLSLEYGDELVKSYLKMYEKVLSEVHNAK